MHTPARSLRSPENLWTKLTPEQQQLVLDAGKVAQDTAREKLVEVEDDYLEKLGKEMEIYDPTQEELEAFQKVAMTSWDIIEQDMGSEKFNEIVNAAPGDCRFPEIRSGSGRTPVIGRPPANERQKGNRAGMGYERKGKRKDNVKENPE